MEDGFVLDFSNRTFAEFFLDELNVDIYEARWAAQGGSKAKRLRYYLRQVDRQAALATLNALWEYREASSVTADYPELDASVRAAYFRIIERLGGKPPEPAVPTAAHRELRVDAAVTSALAARLVDVSTMDPQPRGYAFEKFLKDVFDAYGMSARASFRLSGRADRRQFRARRADLFARSEMEELEGRCGDASCLQRQGRGQGELVPRSHHQPKRLHRRRTACIWARQERRVHGWTRSARGPDRPAGLGRNHRTEGQALQQKRAWRSYVCAISTFPLVGESSQALLSAALGALPGP